jgi:WD40-like Beta Propeller Repeat
MTRAARKRTLDAEFWILIKVLLMRKRIAIPLLFLIGASALAGCNAPVTPDGSPSTPLAPAQSTTQPAAAATAADTSAVVSRPRAPALTPYAAPAIVIPTPLPAYAPANPPANATSLPLPSEATAVPLLTPSHAAQLSLESLRGKIVYRTDLDVNAVQLYAMDADGSNQRPCDCSDVYQAVLKNETMSPDGKQFLFLKAVGGSQRSTADTQIWAHNNETNYEALVTGEAPGFPGLDYASVWSPDSRHIAWVSTTDGNDEIYVHDTVANENRRLTENKDAWDKHPSFSPSGSQIVFWSNRDSAVRKQIWVMNLDGSGQRNLSQDSVNDFDPIWVK